MHQLRVVPCLQGKHQAEGKIMRVFVTGATGALGRHLVPGLVAISSTCSARAGVSAPPSGWPRSTAGRAP